MLIQAKELSHIYMPGTPMRAVAVDKIDLEIGAGEFVGIIGHTGSGKTTLVQHMNGLLRATSGSIAVDGVEIPRKGGDMRAVRHVVGMVFQYPEYQLFEETVAKDVAFGPKNLGLSPDEIAERVREAMDSVGLPYETFAERSPFELSGGQKRRAAIAGVLAMRPRVLALDEPTAGLDPHGREEILSLVRAFHQNGGTVVMISHSMDDVAELCTRVIAMSGGRIAMQGTPQEVFSRGDALRALALDLPAAARVAEELAARGFATRGSVTMRALEDAIARDLEGGADRGAD